MRVKDGGQTLSNAEVLRFLQKKQSQYAQDETLDRASGISPRPEPFLLSLEKHVRHLNSDAYPYTKNPSAYAGSNAEESIHKFSEETLRRIHEPLVEGYKVKIARGDVSVPQARLELREEQAKKELSEVEVLMIMNHAPGTVELLQPMIESVEERFTAEELEQIVEAIKSGV